MAQTENEDSVDKSRQLQLRESAFDNEPVAQIGIDMQGLLAFANRQARSLFTITPGSIGRPLQDLNLPYNAVELRSLIEQVYADKNAINIQETEWQNTQGETVYFDIQIAPLIDKNGTLLGTGMTFMDVSRYKHLQDGLERSNQELEIAYEELQSTNEELQSINEELQFANQELQSTNEELETMNEELQSTNEELHTVNYELHQRSGELDQSNGFLTSILANLEIGVIVLNQDLQVQIWNPKIEDLWELQTSKALGQNFLNLDIGFPVDQLYPKIRSCLNGTSAGICEITLPAVNRHGKSIQCRISCAPLFNTDQELQGAILFLQDKED